MEDTILKLHADKIRRSCNKFGDLYYDINYREDTIFIFDKKCTGYQITLRFNEDLDSLEVNKISLENTEQVRAVFSEVIRMCCKYNIGSITLSDKISRLNAEIGEEEISRVSIITKINSLKYKLMKQLTLF